MNNLFKLIDLSKEYGYQTVLDNINLDMKQGEILGLAGSNGAGKTTLMKILVGLIKQYGGHVKWEEENVKIGCVIETPGFYNYMTGYQNLKFFNEYRGKRKDRMRSFFILLNC